MTYHDRGQRLSGFGAFPPDIGGEMDVDPRSHGTSVTGGRLVPTVWAQRALNAAGIRTVVDGLAGSATLNALRSYWQRLSTASRGPEPALQSGSGGASWVFISSGMEANMSLLRRVPDPSGSTVPAGSWTTPTSQPRPTTASTPSSTTTEGGTVSKPTSIGPEAPLSSQIRTVGGVGDALPWIIGGGAALLGVVAIAVVASRRKKPTPNRRRRR